MARTIEFEVPEDFRSRLKKHINLNIIRPALQDTIEDIDEKVRNLVIEAIQASNVWKALSGDFTGIKHDLMAALGIEDPDSDLDAITNLIYDSIVFSIRGRGRATELGIGLITDSTASKLLNSTEFGTYVSDPSGETIDWLRWVLLGDSDPIAADLFYSVSGLGESSRTGRAIMKNIGGGSWSIRDHLDSKLGENFILNALFNTTFENQIINLVQTTMRKNLRKHSRS